MGNLFLYSHWLALPINTRHKIAEEFGIEKKGSTEVFNNTIKSDGYLVQDIERVLTVETIQKYVGTTKTDLPTLWSMMVAKAQKPEPPMSANTNVSVPKVVKITKKKINEKKTGK